MKHVLPMVRGSALDRILVVGLLVAVFATGAAAQVIEGVSRPTDLNLIWRDTRLSFIQSDLRVLGEDEVLNAEESLEIRLPLVNHGPGKAYNVRVTARLVAPPDHVSGGVEKFIPVMLPGDTTIITIPMEATEFAETGKVRLRIDNTEKYDRIASPVGIDVPVLAMPIPQLAIHDSGVDDDLPDNVGRVPNSRIEVGERVQLKLLVANKGQGEARGVRVAIQVPPGLTLYPNRPTKTPGDIEPGKTKIVDFTFDVPPSYRGDERLPFVIDLIDGERPRFNVRDTVVLSLNTRSKSTSDIINITWDIPPSEAGGIVVDDLETINVDVDVNIPRCRRDNENAWAVIIGNRNYQQKDLELPYAHNDAGIMREYALSAMGIPNDHIISLRDAGINQMKRVLGSEENPRRELASQVNSASDVFVYYSGHGAPDYKSDRPYLLPVDCYPTMVADDGYSLDLMLSNLSQLEVRSVVVVIDACFSGFSSVGPLVKGVASVGKRITDITKMAKSESMVVFTASSAAEWANAYDEKDHLMFTYFYLKGLQGKADANGDGLITAGEMFGYVSDRSEGVPAAVRHLFRGDRTQTPEFKGDRSFILRGAVR